MSQYIIIHSTSIIICLRIQATIVDFSKLCFRAVRCRFCSQIHFYILFLPKTHHGANRSDGGFVQSVMFSHTHIYVISNIIHIDYHGYSVQHLSRIIMINEYIYHVKCVLITPHVRWLSAATDEMSCTVLQVHPICATAYIRPSQYHSNAQIPI